LATRRLENVVHFHSNVESIQVICIDEKSLYDPPTDA
jgi:hypothetical protein